MYEDYVHCEIGKNFMGNEVSQLLKKQKVHERRYVEYKNVCLWGQHKSIFDHPPTLQELPRVSSYFNGFVLKPYSVPQYDVIYSRGYHFCLRYKVNDQESMYSFITGENRVLEKIFRPSFTVEFKSVACRL